MCSFVRCIMYTGQCPPQGTSLEVSLPAYIPSPHAPTSLRCSLPPPLASSLPPFPSLRPCLRPCLSSHSFHSPTLPAFLHSRSQPSSHHRFLTHSPGSLPPILCHSSLHPCLLCLSPAIQFNVHRMCAWQAALCCVAPSHA